MRRAIGRAWTIVLQQRIGAGIFAGEGFILQRVTGPGTVWLDLSGEVIAEDAGAWRAAARPCRAYRHAGSQRLDRHPAGAGLP